MQNILIYKTNHIVNINMYKLNMRKMKDFIKCFFIQFKNLTFHESKSTHFMFQSFTDSECNF